MPLEFYEHYVVPMVCKKKQAFTKDYFRKKKGMVKMAYFESAIDIVEYELHRCTMAVPVRRCLRACNKHFVHSFSRFKQLLHGADGVVGFLDTTCEHIPTFCPPLTPTNTWHSNHRMGYTVPITACATGKQLGDDGLAHVLIALHLAKWQTCICATVLQMQMHMQQGGFMHNDFLGISYQVTCISLQWTANFVNQTLLECVAEHPGTSTRVIAGQLGISHTTVWKVWKEHCYNAYHKTKAHKLHPPDYGPRVEFCEWYNAQCRQVSTFPSLILFTDEATFNENGIFNSKNCIHWATENPHTTYERGQQ
ncbi:hypothetical protein PR048_031376 [Dryococelus australis]|uniref:Transposase n=1 Tax=Dryococelus australis TaxID=614101 RepID=A0ABQ9G544_9NEOP|nr:hypothetical protein PR048_031376 [Dryococelus australis]